MVQPGLAINLFVLFFFETVECLPLKIFNCVRCKKSLNALTPLVLLPSPIGRPLHIMKKLIRGLLNVKV